MFHVTFLQGHAFFIWTYCVSSPGFPSPAQASFYTSLRFLDHFPECANLTLIALWVNAFLIYSLTVWSCLWKSNRLLPVNPERIGSSVTNLGLFILVRTQLLKQLPPLLDTGLSWLKTIVRLVSWHTWFFSWVIPLSLAHQTHLTAQLFLLFTIRLLFY